MLVVTLASRKGGAGKTTLAVALAVAAQREGRAAIVVDTDPQGSATKWAELRAHVSDTPVVTACTPDRLTAVLAASRNAGGQFVAIDTAPAATDRAARQAARAADLVLIPCRASAADLTAIGDTVQIVQRAQVPAAAVLNAAPVRNPLTDQALETIAAYGIEAAPVVIYQRIAHVHAFTEGVTAGEVVPKGKAAQEIDALYRWIVQRPLL